MSYVERSSKHSAFFFPLYHLAEFIMLQLEVIKQYKFQSAAITNVQGCVCKRKMILLGKFTQIFSKIKRDKTRTHVKYVK